jgi:hypothetical protein
VRLQHWQASERSPVPLGWGRRCRQLQVADSAQRGTFEQRLGCSRKLARSSEVETGPHLRDLNIRKTEEWSCGFVLGVVYPSLPIGDARSRQACNRDECRQRLRSSLLAIVDLRVEDLRLSHVKELHNVEVGLYSGRDVLLRQIDPENWGDLGECGESPDTMERN